MSAREPVEPDAVVAALVARARAAQRAFETWTQERVDEAVVAAGWAIVEPERNRALAERAVARHGLGNVDDKIAQEPAQDHRPAARPARRASRSA